AASDPKSSSSSSSDSDDDEEKKPVNGVTGPGSAVSSSSASSSNNNNSNNNSNNATAPAPPAAAVVQAAIKQQQQLASQNKQQQPQNQQQQQKQQQQQQPQKQQQQQQEQEQRQQQKQPEQQQRAKQAKNTSSRPGPARKKPKTTDVRGSRIFPGDEDGPFELNLDALQGRWRHSHPNLGMLTVRGESVKFDSGLPYEVKEMPGGQLDMAGWQASKEKSTPEAIVWIKDQFICSWFLEEDLERADEEGLDSKNIIDGKRGRARVNYRALDRQMQDEEDRQTRNVYSDASSDDDRRPSRGREAMETVSPKELAESNSKQAAKASDLLQKWLLSTATARHDEILKRKGKLSTRLPVELQGAGRKLLEKEFRLYELKLSFRVQETVVIVDAAARQRFAERNKEPWQSAWKELLSRPPPVEAAPSTAPRKRKLRRVVDSDEEAEAEAQAASSDAPAASEAQASPDAPPAAQEDQLSLEAGVQQGIEAAKARLESPQLAAEAKSRDEEVL
ncbi:unnamed protein product, partial [Polarella glacialis]